MFCLFIQDIDIDEEAIIESEILPKVTKKRILGISSMFPKGIDELVFYYQNKKIKRDSIYKVIEKLGI